MDAQKQAQDQSARYNTMLNDTKFIAWLTEYDPDWRMEYSGNLVGMYDAWCAGRESIGWRDM